MAANTGGIKAGRAFIVIDAVDMTGRVLKNVRDKFVSIGRDISNVGRGLLTKSIAMLLPTGLALKTFTDFDDAMRRVQARTSGTAAEMKVLRDQAQELGRTTAFTAGQVGNLQAQLAQKGFNRSEIANMTGPTLALARAAGAGKDLMNDAVMAADLVGATIRGFRKDSKDAANVADLLTAAANGTNYTIEELIVSLQYASEASHKFDLSLEKTLAGLGVMADLNIDASVAGTAWRNMLTYMSKASDRTKFNEKLQALTGTTIEFVDAAGNLKDLPSILFAIDKAMGKLGSADQADMMHELFGTRAMLPAGAIGSMGQRFEELMSLFALADGQAQKTMEVMESGLGGAFRNTQSVIEDLGIAIGTALENPLKSLMDLFRYGVTAVQDYIRKNRGLVVILAGLGASGAVAGASLLGVGLALTAFSSVFGTLARLTFPIAVLLRGLVQVPGAFKSIGKGISDLITLVVTLSMGIYRLAASVVSLSVSFIARAIPSLVSFAVTLLTTVIPALTLATIQFVRMNSMLLIALGGGAIVANMAYWRMFGHVVAKSILKIIPLVRLLGLQLIWLGDLVIRTGILIAVIGLRSSSIMVLKWSGIINSALLKIGGTITSLGFRMSLFSSTMIVAWAKATPALFLYIGGLTTAMLGLYMVYKLLSSQKMPDASPVFKSASGIGQSGLKNFVGYASQVGQNTQDVFSHVYDVLQQKGAGILETLKTTMSGIFSAAETGNWTQMWDILKKSAEVSWHQITDTMKTLWEDAIWAMYEAWVGVQELLTKNGSDMFDFKNNWRMFKGLLPGGDKQDAINAWLDQKKQIKGAHDARMFAMEEGKKGMFGEARSKRTQAIADLAEDLKKLAEKAQRDADVARTPNWMTDDPELLGSLFQRSMDGIIKGGGAELAATPANTGFEKMTAEAARAVAENNMNLEKILTEKADEERKVQEDQLKKLEAIDKNIDRIAKMEGV